MLGIREYARDGGADVWCLDLDLGLLEGVGRAGDCCGCSSLLSDEDTRERGRGEVGGERVSDRSCCGCCCGCCCSSVGGGAREGEDGEHVPPDGASSARSGAGFAATPADSEGGAANAGKASGKDAEAGATNKDDATNREKSGDDVDVVHSLFAFPAECNATGLRPDLGIAARVKRGALSSRCRCCHCRCRDGRPKCCDGYSGSGSCSGNDSDLVNAVESKRIRCESKRGGEEPVEAGNRSRGRRRRPKEQWWVLLDAAKFVGTGSLDLSTVEADFVALSFYKMFG